MLKLLPAVLETSNDAIVQKVRQLLPYKSQFARIQLDVTDGQFVSSRTVDDPYSIPDLGTEIEAHLMIKHPEMVLRGWLQRTDVRRLIVHAETVINMEDVITRVKKAGKEIGIALRPETPSRVLEPWLDHIDAAIFLSVQPGRQGGVFISDVLEKVREIKKRHPRMVVALDGGLNEYTLPDAIEAGADEFVVGSALWNAGSLTDALQKIQTVLHNTYR